MSAKERKVRLLGYLLVVFAILLLLYLIWQTHESNNQRDTAQGVAQTQAQQKKNLAEEVSEACASGQVLMDSSGGDLCSRAEVIASAPVNTAGPQGPPGPQGPRGFVGVAGSDGVDGKTGAQGVDGSKGSDGADGANGVGKAGKDGATGLTGATGVSGKEGFNGAAGKAGADGKAGVDGKPGATGPQGLPGPVGPPGQPGIAGQPGSKARGIQGVTCNGTGQYSNWLITYTDGTTQPADGPCKVSISNIPATPINPAP